uniref:Uncharacterized protein n=2 Tax=Oryza brachyantha TaxID=4533 RepID=J3LRD4_ORYBR
MAAKSPEPVSATPAALAPAPVPDTPAMAPSAMPAEPETSEAPGVPVDASPATVAAPGQAVPGDSGSSTGSQVGSKMPELLHSAGVRSSRKTAAGTVLITLFLAYVSAMYG